MSLKTVPAQPDNLSPLAKWDLVAEDYYSSLHITTRNFDAIIEAHLAGFLKSIDQGPILEVGGGSGRLQGHFQSSQHRIIVGDMSTAMMRKNLPRECHRTEYIQMSAFSCPFKDEFFTAVVSLLGDSFATDTAFREFRRVIMVGGRLLIALPSLSWGKALRKAMGWAINETFIPTVRHGHIRVPSYLYGEDELGDMLTNLGFIVEKVNSYSASSVIDDTCGLSPHVLLAASALSVRPHELPLVTMALASKRSSG